MSPPGRDDVLAANGHVLVTGGPGCGKTTIALRKAFVRIGEGMLPGQQVLFLSFSRAAVARVIQSSKTELPATIRDRLDVQTLHSFFWTVLRGHSYLLGAPQPLQLLLPHDARAHKGRRFTDDAWKAEQERLFLEEGRLSFDLFAPKAKELLMASSSIVGILCDRYPLIVLDEAQDTGLDQWACVELLSSHSQLIALADLDQQIYDFRPDVSPDRIRDILQGIAPLVVDLAQENHRSCDTDIAKLGNDIIAGGLTQSSYRGASAFTFSPAAASRDEAVRDAVELVTDAVREQTGNDPQSIAILARTNKGVALISRALRGGDEITEIPHKVAVDETQVALASRVLAACLEPVEELNEAVSAAMTQMAALNRAKEKKTADGLADRLVRWAKEAKDGRYGRAACPNKLRAWFDGLDESPLSGNPELDWLRVRRFFEGAGSRELEDVANKAVYLMAFNRGRLIADALARSWTGTGYRGAQQVIDDAVAHDTLNYQDLETSGLNVMTMHKSKGKEFDAVVLVHLGNISTFEHAPEPPRDMRARRLLRVAVTRARHHALFMIDESRSTTLLSRKR